MTARMTGAAPPSRRWGTCRRCYGRAPIGSSGKLLDHWDRIAHRRCRPDTPLN